MPLAAFPYTSVKDFKLKLDRYWSDQEVKYNYQAEINLRTVTGSHTETRNYTNNDEVDIVAQQPASTGDPKR